jgi:DNA gyrase/topoisomerase IV subunit B
VGVSVVNALSDRLDVTVRRDGQLHHMTFSRGKREGDLRVLPDPEVSTSMHAYMRTYVHA